MRFCQLQDTYSFQKVRRRYGLSIDAFYRGAIRRCGQLAKNNRDPKWRKYADMQLDLFAEWKWWNNERPYYNVWPAIAETLTRFDVDKVPFRSFLSAPDPHIAVQFQQGGVGGIMCILASIAPAGSDPYPDHHLVIVTQQHLPDERSRLNGEYPTSTQILAIPAGDEGKNLGVYGAEDWFGDQPGEYPMQKVAIAVFLMERSPELFVPVILAKDVRKYERADEAGKRSIEKRAIRHHGQRGYHLGRAIETIPHYRRPHPALYWTGKGGSIAKIIFRQGAIVKRAAMTRVPTGRLGGEEALSVQD
jgi:hypothetical protein